MADDVARMISEQTQAANEQWRESEASSGCCGGSAPQGQGCGCHGPSSMPNHSTTWEDKLAAAINDMRPLFMSRGGDIELLAIEDRSAVVRISGQGLNDELAMEQIRGYVQLELINAVPGFDELVAV